MLRFFTSRKDNNPDPKAVSRALYTADVDQMSTFIQKGLDVVNLTIGAYEDTLLMKAVLCSDEMRGSDEQVQVIRLLLQSGADVNQPNKEGANALHYALAQHRLAKAALVLIREGTPDVHFPDPKAGNTPLFVAIREYGYTWREEHKEVNALRFDIVKELLDRGADPDRPNKHGVTPRFWTEQLPPEDRLHSLL